MQILKFIIGFTAVALFSLALAGYGGYLATLILDEKKRRRALLIVWSLAILGILATGLNQYFLYKSEQDLQTQLNSIAKTGKDILKGITGKERWKLTPEQINQLSHRMSKFVPLEKRDNLITCIMGNPDSTKLAIDLVKAFRMAGWNISEPGKLLSANFTGVIIKINSKQSNPPGLKELVTFLREVGIEPTGAINNSVPPNRFRILIGMKP